MSLDAAEIRWWVAFVIASAVVGPVVLRPPIWPEYSREQLVGFTIGMVAWSTAAAAILATATL